MTDALSTASASQPEAHTGQPSTHSGPDGAGAASNVKDPRFAERILRASASAVDQHLAESSRSANAKRAGVPLESMGNGAGEASLAEGAPEPLQSVLDGHTAFDEETCRQVVEIAVGLLNDGAAAVIRAIAKRETGDEKLAEEAAQSVRMSEKIEGTVKTGAIACARKYAVNMAYAPELMLGGGLIIWGGQITMTSRALKAKGAELRQRAKEKGSQ